jgi:curved DNA-binding protein CbpA
MKTPYDVLGVAPDADDKTIDIAFRRAAKTCHPDNNLNNGAAERQFKLVLAARDTLKNPEWRALYRYLQFRRQHERRHWTITILSCVVSAVVSGGLVAVLQPSASESVTGEPAALAGPAMHEIATLQERFEVVGLSQEPAASGSSGSASEREPETASAKREPETASTKREPEAASADREPETADLLAKRQTGPAAEHAAALEEESVSAAQSSAAPAVREPESRTPTMPVQRNRTSKACDRGRARTANSTPMPAESCRPIPGHAQTRPAKPASHKPFPPSVATTKEPSRGSVLHRSTAALPAKRQSQPPAPKNDRFAETIRPPYALTNECWSDEGGGRWSPCAGRGE